MSDTPAVPAILEPQNRQELLNIVRLAGENHLSPEQTALELGLSAKETQILWYKDSEIAITYAKAHLEQQIKQLDMLKKIAAGLEDKGLFQATKYLYELFSGNKSSTTFNIAIQNNHPQTVRTESAIRLVEAIDAETVEKIAND